MKTVFVTMFVIVAADERLGAGLLTCVGRSDTEELGSAGTNLDAELLGTD